jgi:dihydroflavonol-4-reductase
MWGPHDAGPTPSGKLVFDPSRISCPQWFHRVAPRLWMHGTWHLACSAWRKSAAPESDISSVGTFAELAYIIANLAALTGAKPPKRHIPFSAAIALATAVETWSRMTGTISPMSVEAIRLMNARLRVTSAKAEKELGVTFRPFAVTLADTVSWARTTSQEHES